VWPETAIPYEISQSDYLISYISDLAKRAHATILVGAFYENDDGVLENVIYQVKPDGEISDTRYSKQHLVPFGEYVPMRELIMAVIPPLADVGMLSDDLGEGTSSSVHETDIGKVGSLICFDSIYEPLARQSAEDGAELLCISTNDSWFGSGSAVYEHNRHSVLRAVETGRYVVRSANTGISSIISPTGEVLDYLEPLERGNVTADIQMIEETTLYDKVGNIIVLFSVFVLVIICILKSLLKRDI